ncbi:hypothetical protein PAXRUDRAFT_825120 [Paxillus rubicundulus Ve08.2h10]|uniref:Uncharacterized protein n=1 Tax=Paxillus rubicundulus Ve08.2h10 TaxID=930991 RepID=A0A0D0E6R2_9AGAM|nr:hypothetical protein PAXRUDRAFT_825120 [Paxillus rubicundulus Ve08.2h10]
MTRTPRPHRLAGRNATQRSIKPILEWPWSSVPALSSASTCHLIHVYPYQRYSYPMDTVVSKALSITDRVELGFQFVTVLFVKVVAMASEMASLDTRVSNLETVHPTGSDSVQLSQRVNDLCDMVASQQEEIRGLKRDLVRQGAEVDVYQNKIKTLTTKLDDDGKDFNTFVNGLHCTLVDHVKEQQRQASELAKVKDDVALFTTKLSSVQVELSVVTAVMVPTEAQLAGQAAKEARRKRILASVAQRVEEIELAQEVQILCPPPPAKREAAAAKENQPVVPGGATSRSSSKGKEVEGTTKAPQPSSTQAVQPGAGPSVKVSALPAPRKSMLPAPRKSMLPAPLKRITSVSGNTSKVVQSVPIPAKESTTARAQSNKITNITANRAPLEPIVPSGAENEAPALLASSSLAALDNAVQESRVDILGLMPTLDSMAFLDTSFSISVVPSIFRSKLSRYKGKSLYEPAVRKPVAAKPSRRL